MDARATLAPTARRLAEARRRGQLATSGDLTAAGATAGAALALIALGPILWRGGVALAHAQWAAAMGGNADGGLAWRTALGATAWATAPVLGAAVVGALAFGFAQTRGAMMAPRRGSGAAGPGRLLALLLGFGKLAALAGVAWATLRPAIPLLAGLAGAAPERVLAVLGVVATRLAIRLAIGLLLLGMADYGVRWLACQRALRMTPDEIKRERRETEGDERLRARRRQVQRTTS